MRTYRVLTFEHEKVRNNGIRPSTTILTYSAYTRDANPRWPGCKMYEVEAASGSEAKKKAIEIRKEDVESGQDRSTNPEKWGMPIVIKETYDS